MPRQATPKLSNAVDLFIERRFNRSKSSQVRYSYVSLLRRFVTYTGDLTVGSLKPAHVEDFFYGPGGLSETCGRTTLGKYRNDLKQFIDFCHRREWLPLSGAAMVSGVGDRSTRANRDRYRLSPTQMLLLMEHAENPRDRALFAVVANTGIRISEALDLKVRDVNFQRGELYVRLIKLGRQEVTYPITSDLEPELRKWLTAYSKELDQSLERGWFLFPAKHAMRFHKGSHGKPVRPAVIWNPTGVIHKPREIIQYMAANAGIELEPGDGWHTIRRSVARVFFDAASEQGHDAALRMTQALLKHRSASTTEVYLGLDLENRRVEEVMKGKPFLTARANLDNVRPLRAIGEGE